MNTLRKAHFELIEAFGRLSNFYGSPIFVQIANQFFGTLVYTFLLIRVYIFKEKEDIQVPNLEVEFVGEFTETIQTTPVTTIGEEFQDQLKLANEVFGYFNAIFRIILLIFLIEMLSNRKDSAVAILKR